MTGPEHYRAAQRLLSQASHEDSVGNPVSHHGAPIRPETHAALIARANVHAQLAAVAATVSAQNLAGDPESRGYDSEDWDEWMEAMYPGSTPNTNEEN